jgi:hypothetical protein
VEREYVIGLDLGQKQDHSAIAVMERIRTVYQERDRVTWEPLEDTRTALTHVERLPLGIPYPEVADRVCELLGSGAMAGRSTLVVDETGVGAPVVDMLRRRATWPVAAVTITGGERASITGSSFRVPKRDLITGLVLAFENREVEIARGVPAVNALITELLSMRVTVTAAGKERFETWRSGAHDDMVLAVALAWWRMGQAKAPGIWGTRRLISW